MKLGISVKSLGDDLFCDCENLNRITIPKSLRVISVSTFEETPWFEKKKKEAPLVMANSIVIDGENCEGEVIIPDNVVSISWGAFCGNERITSVIIPESVTYIGGYAFNNCVNLKNVVILDSGAEIDEEAFTGTPWYKNRQSEKSQ